MQRKIFLCSYLTFFIFLFVNFSAANPANNFDKLAFEDGLKRSKNNFLRLYRSIWQNFDMNEKLENAIDIAFDENTKDLFFGTTGVQLAIDKDNLIKKIQEAIAYKFQADFDDFLINLEEKWGATLQKDVADFYKRTSIFLIASENNPMAQAYIRSSSINENKSLSVMEQIKFSIQEKYPDLAISSGKLASGFAAVVLRKQINKIIGDQLMKTGLRKLSGSAAGKVAGMAVPAVGWALIAWSAYDFFSTAWNAPDEVRNMLHEKNIAFYQDKIPEFYWEAMQPFVMDTFISSYERLQQRKEQARKLAKNNIIIELSKDLNDDETILFIERISELSRILGLKNDPDDLLTDFGQLIRDLSQRDFEIFALILQKRNKIQIKDWLSIAGNKYFDLYSSLPSDTWDNFQPNQNSLDALLWINKLPPKARAIAVKLSIDDINWIIHELPERYISLLFSQNNPNIIHSEINRLSAIPAFNSRKPWLSSISYFWALYAIYFKIALVLFFVIFISIIILRFKRLRSKKIMLVSPQLKQINDLPQIQTMPAKKYKIKLKISPKIANELKTITWDISQQLLPSENPDDKYNRLFSVELENLDAFASWLANYKNDFQVLQPDELIFLLENKYKYK